MSWTSDGKPIRLKEIGTLTSSLQPRRADRPTWAYICMLRRRHKESAEATGTADSVCMRPKYPLPE
eukprot:9794702-Prorocentrum_lima.AAC.1